MKVWVYPFFVTILGACIWYFTFRGFYTGRIDVLFGHLVYAKAQWAKHPWWYVFGMMEWIFLSVIAGIMIIKSYRSSIHQE